MLDLIKERGRRRRSFAERQQIVCDLQHKMTDLKTPLH